MSPWITRAVLALGFLGLVIQAWSAIQRPERGDFVLHHEFGRRLDQGVFLYFDGMHVPYPPAWAVPHVPVSWLPVAWGKGLFFILGLGALVLLFRILQSLSERQLPVASGRRFWLAAGTLVIAGRFISRDFDDGGQNLVLLGLSWLGIASFCRGRWFFGGASLGLAAALKCTPVIFLGYFLVKREWKMTFASVGWAVFFFLSPVFWTGPAGLWSHLKEWQANARLSLGDNPSQGILGPERLQNKALRPTLARYLMHLPPGHPGRHYIDNRPKYDPQRTPHPWSSDFLDLSPGQADFLISWILLAGVAGVAWLLRGPLLKNDSLTVAWESAILSVLMLLYSPITWGQHCVALIPALYLLLRSVAAGTLAPRRGLGFLFAFAGLVLLSNRAFIGTSLSLLVESYHPVTFALVILVVLMFRWRPRRMVLPGDFQYHVSAITLEYRDPVEERLIQSAQPTAQPVVPQQLARHAE